MEHRRLGPHQTGDSAAATAPVHGPVRQRRDAALRTGQVVPGRAPAPLGAGALLEARRPAGLARRRARPREPTPADGVGRAGADQSPGAAPWRRPEAGPRGPGRPAALDQGRGRSARQSRTDRRGPRRGGCPFRPAPRHGGRPLQGRRLRPAPSPRRGQGRGRRLAERGLAFQARAALPDPRGFASGPAPTAGQPADPEAGGLSARHAAGPL